MGEVGGAGTAVPPQPVLVLLLLLLLITIASAWTIVTWSREAPSLPPNRIRLPLVVRDLSSRNAWADFTQHLQDITRVLARNGMYDEGDGGGGGGGGGQARSGGDQARFVVSGSTVAQLIAHMQPPGPTRIQAYGTHGDWDVYVSPRPHGLTATTARSTKRIHSVTRVMPPEWAHERGGRGMTLNVITMTHPVTADIIRDFDLNAVMACALVEARGRTTSVRFAAHPHYMQWLDDPQHRVRIVDENPIDIRTFVRLLERGERLGVACAIPSTSRLLAKEQRLLEHYHDKIRRLSPASQRLVRRRYRMWQRRATGERFVRLRRPQPDHPRAHQARKQAS